MKEMIENLKMMLVESKLLLANYGIYLIVSISDIETIVRWVCFLIPAGYTLWKWITEWKKKKKLNE